MVLTIYLEYYTLKKNLEDFLLLQNVVIFLICCVLWNNVNQIAHLLEQLLNYRTSLAHMQAWGFTSAATVRNTEHCATPWPLCISYNS